MIATFDQFQAPGQPILTRSTGENGYQAESLLKSSRPACDRSWMMKFLTTFATHPTWNALTQGA